MAKGGERARCPEAKKGEILNLYHAQSGSVQLTEIEFRLRITTVFSQRPSFPARALRFDRLRRRQIQRSDSVHRTATGRLRQA